MEFRPQPDQAKASFQVKAAIVITIVTITGLAIWLPESRRFLLGIGIAILICVLIGVVVAGILRVWHRYKPVNEENVEHKRPLGLD